MRSRRSQKTKVLGNGATETTFLVEGSLLMAYESVWLTRSFFLPELGTPAAPANAMPDVQQDSPTTNPPATPVTPQRRQRRPSFKARDLDNAYNQLFHDSPTLRNRRPRSRSNNRNRRIAFADVDSVRSSPSPSRQSEHPSTTPPSPAQSSHETSPPGSESSESQSERSRTPSPVPGVA